MQVAFDLVYFIQYMHTKVHRVFVPIYLCVTIVAHMGRKVDVQYSTMALLPSCT